MSSAQLKTIKGIITADDEVEGIHILNKTALKYTISDTDGAFQILAKANDTLTISSLKYQLKTVVISKRVAQLGYIQVRLEEKINELDEVVVGQVLTGNLGSDLKNTGTKEEINFYDLGIPGYTGKPKTIPERKLADADHGRMFAFYGIGLAVNINKLLNKISGRTKKLKANVNLEKRDKCMKRFRDEYSRVIFEKENFTHTVKTDYFYFCLDDPNFLNICTVNNTTENIAFLQRKLKAYKDNLNSGKKN